MVMTPPHMAAKRRKAVLELALLKMKEKIFGSLSEAEERRRKELLRLLAIRY